MDSFEVNAKR